MRRLLSLLLVTLLFPAGLAAADYRRGVEAYKAGDYAAALAELTPLGRAGDPVAQFNLGYMYAQGLGAPKDMRQAAQWFEKAAKQGHAMAQLNLGILYVGGKGVAKDPARGAKWLRRAADQGLAAAQNNLGYLYSRGLGVPKDLVRAHMWFSLAATSGHLQAKRNRDLLAQKMRPEQVREAQHMAIQWLDQSRQAGVPTADRKADKKVD